MTIYNNFYLYFPPSGMYRRLNLNPELVSSLDKVLIEINFDQDKFLSIMKKRADFIPELMEHFFKKTLISEERIKELENEENKINQQLEELLEPIYKRMIDLGYTDRELTG